MAYQAWMARVTATYKTHKDSVTARSVAASNICWKEAGSSCWMSEPA